MIKVWVTRSEDDEEKLANELRNVGLEPVVEPVLQIEILGDAQSEIASLTDQDWLVLTSPLAIKTVARPKDKGPRVAVVGPSSVILAIGLGFNVRLVSPSSDGQGLWHAITPLAQSRRICFARSALAEVPKIAGLDIQAPIIYDVKPRDFDVQVIAQVHIVTFTSPSAVASVVNKLGVLSLPVVSIGETTSAALRRAGIHNITESKQRSMAAMASAAKAIAERIGETTKEKRGEN
jgi:uroporphyrinogen-III synthase